MQQNKAKGRILADPHNLSLNIKPAIHKKNKIKRKTTAGLATESEPRSFLTNGMLVNGSDAIMAYQANPLQFMQAIQDQMDLLRFISSITNVHDAEKKSD